MLLPTWGTVGLKEDALLYDQTPGMVRAGWRDRPVEGGRLQALPPGSAALAAVREGPEGYPDFCCAGPGREGLARLRWIVPRFPAPGPLERQEGALPPVGGDRRLALEPACTAWGQRRYVVHLCRTKSQPKHRVRIHEAAIQRIERREALHARWRGERFDAMLPRGAMEALTEIVRQNGPRHVTRDAGAPEPFPGDGGGGKDDGGITPDLGGKPTALLVVPERRCEQRQAAACRVGVAAIGSPPVEGAHIERSSRGPVTEAQHATLWRLAVVVVTAQSVVIIAPLGAGVAHRPRQEGLQAAAVVHLRAPQARQRAHEVHPAA